MRGRSSERMVRVSRWGMAVDHLARLQFALEVCCYKLPSPHTHPVAGCNGREGTQRRGAHGGTKRLIIIDAVGLSAALHAKPCLHGAITLPLVDPDEPYKGAARRELGAINCGPASVGSMVCNLGALGRLPSAGVVGHCLLIR
eukprot:4834124-Pleurochrysis_carterae.AAC.4